MPDGRAVIDRVSLDAGPGAPTDAVDAVVHRPRGGTASGIGVLLTHGAGGDLDGAGLTALAGGLAAAGHLAVRCNLPYRQAGRRAPPRAERSVDAFAAIATDARRLGPRLHGWAVGGKSYGGRVASLAVAAGLDAAALVFYGYPLHAPGRHDRLRVNHWPHVTVPCLFLQGTRDPLCDLDLLRAHLPDLGGPATLHVVEGGDHSLAVRGEGAAGSEGEVLTQLATVVGDWLRDVTRTPHH
ncbi:MAG TPA: alpha/beta family hydrolase [Nitriliruptorales bacterium]|nr:alpha/beta family hydrolase [Nitriliruptorales bacterium]